MAAPGSQRSGTSRYDLRLNASWTGTHSQGNSDVHTSVQLNIYEDSPLDALATRFQNLRAEYFNAGSTDVTLDPLPRPRRRLHKSPLESDPDLEVRRDPIFGIPLDRPETLAPQTPKRGRTQDLLRTAVEKGKNGIRNRKSGSSYGNPIDLTESTPPRRVIGWAQSFDDSDVEMIDVDEFEPPTPIRDCAVCGDSVPVPDYPTLVNCSHEGHTCPGCYAQWITTQLETKSWNAIECPEARCGVLLQHHDVQQYASQEVFERFDALSIRGAINDDPNFIWCLALGCGSGQVHESGDEGNIFRCVACGYRMCVIHQCAWHEGETCEEYEYRHSGRKDRDQRRQEKASLKAIKELTKKCPGPGCGWRIQKNHGCDHMTCTKCRHEFCFLCLADHRQIIRWGNDVHEKHCKYHSSNLPANRRRGGY